MITAADHGGIDPHFFERGFLDGEQEVHLRLPAFVSPTNPGHAVPISPRVVRTEPEIQHERVKRASSLSVCTRPDFRQKNSRTTNNKSLKPFKLGVNTKHDMLSAKSSVESAEATRDLLERFPVGHNTLSCMRHVRVDHQRSARQETDSHPANPTGKNLSVLTRINPNQHCRNTETTLRTMTWRVCNMTTRNLNIFKTLEGFLQQEYQK